MSTLIRPISCAISEFSKEISTVTMQCSVKIRGVEQPALSVFVHLLETSEVVFHRSNHVLFGIVREHSFQFIPRFHAKSSDHTNFAFWGDQIEQSTTTNHQSFTFMLKYVLIFYGNWIEHPESLIWSPLFWITGLEFCSKCFSNAQINNII